MLAFVFTRLSSAAEVSAPGEESAFPGTLKSFLGIGRSGHVVAKLARLFALDSFAGGFVVQSFAAYWFYLRFGAVLTELKNRGVKDIFIACVDGLKGFPEAIEALYPQTEVRLCIVHLVRASLNVWRV